MAKFNLQNINEITEGRELLEKKPSKLSLWFIYILIAVFISFFVWAWFSNKEVVISVPGIVAPSEDTYTVSSLINGVIKEIDVKNGQHVEKGQKLFTLNIKDASLQLENLKTQEKNLNQNISDMNSLINSINSDSNYLTNKNKYYAEYQSYIAQNNIINDEINGFNTQKNKMQSQINNLELLQKSINENINYVKENSLYSSEYQNYASSRQAVENKLSELQSQLTNIENEQKKIQSLQNSISNDTNSVNSNTSRVQYQDTVSVLENKLKNLEVQKENLQKSEQKNMSKQDLANYNNQLTSLQSEINNVKLEIKSASNTNRINNQKNKVIASEQNLQNQNADINYQNQISNIQSKITDTNAQINALPNSYLTQINQQIQELDNQLTGINASATKNQGDKSLTKWQLISQINQNLTAYKNKIQQVKENIKQLSNQIKYGDITANSSGIIYIPTMLHIGTVLQGGQAIAQIIPSQNRFEIKLMIPNDRIGNIKVNDEVKYSFNSFPYTEYGFLKGNLKTIGVTSELNPKTGLSYYSASSTLTKNIISNKQGKTGSIKLGMTCNAKIISRKEKMLYYILNQLGLKTDNF